MKKLIYCCVFFQKQYMDLLRLLSLSLYFFGNIKDDTDIVILSCYNFRDDIIDIFKILNINVYVHCIDLYSLFSAAYSRLFIFDLPMINDYNKILYLDTDILIMNDINNILNLDIDNLLYAVEEGIISDKYHGIDFFDFTKVDRDTTAFTSGILYFNNHIDIKNLFSKILDHINKHIELGLKIPLCFDQDFIVYHAITDNIYNNKLLIKYVVNNSTTLTEHTVHHFMGWPGNYQSKNLKMIKFLRDVLNNMMTEDNENMVLNNIYNWKHDGYNINGSISFLSDGQLKTSFRNGSYTILKNRIIKASWFGYDHCLKFDENYETFISVRINDFNVSSGVKTKI